MSTSRTADPVPRIPLTGADCFLRAFDAETRRRNGASHLAQVVLRLGPGFDVEAFRRTLRAVVDANPILRAPLRRRAGLGAPVYATGRAARCAPPPVEVHDAPQARRPDALPEVLRARLNESRRPRRGELLRVDVVRYPGDPDGERGPVTDVGLTWLHMLFDGAGIEHFVTFLERCREGARSPGEVPPADRPGAPPLAPLPASSRERGTLAMRWQRRMSGLAELGTRSPAGPERRVRQDLVCDLRTFSREQTADIVQRAASLAGFLTPMIFHLAAAIRAHHAVQRARGTVPGSYVVPLPVNLRPKGEDGALFRSRVSMLWFQVPAALAEDRDALLAALREQRRRAIREGQIAAGVAAMDYARFAPAPLYARMARRPLGGELCSFFFAYTDEFCPGLEHFFGAPLEAGCHVPSVPPSPGSGLVLSLHAGRLTTTHVHQRGVFAEDELARFREQLERDLAGGE